MSALEGAALVAAALIGRTLIDLAIERHRSRRQHPKEEQQ